MNDQSNPQSPLESGTDSAQPPQSAQLPQPTPITPVNNESEPSVQEAAQQPQTATQQAAQATAQVTPQPASQPAAQAAPNPVPSMQPIISSRPLGPNTAHKRYQGPKPALLLVLDGWGIGPNNAGNAIVRAQTPNMDRLWMSYPHTQLEASGQAVGLPQNEDGNTETGHLNIGAGHIVYQDLPRINMSIADGTFYNNQAFLNAIAHVKKNNSTLHLMGLVGAGGVHSNIEHLYALLNLCGQHSVTKVLIHCFTDGRDSPPTSGINYISKLHDHCQQTGIGQIASLMGRYFAMDRDHRWERVEKAYNALVLGSGQQCTVDPMAAVQAQYAAGVTDEFLEPIVVCNEDGTHRTIADNDAAIFINYRIDRPRELTRAFVQPDFEQGVKHEAFDPYTEKYEKTNIQQPKHTITFQRQKIVQNLYFVTMTRYEDNIPVDVAFPPQSVKQPLGKVFADSGLRQLRITETEKERFVSYYMNGQIEDMYPGEERVIIPSKGVKSYDEAPEMSAYEIADEMIAHLKTNKYDVVISNICNGDMVGHTGNLEASIRACEIVDEVVGKIVNAIVAMKGVVFITADHGNVEEMINSETGEVDTEHSTYPVPFMIIGQQYANRPIMLPTGILADIAPTMLHVMGIEKPPAMTGRALL